MIDATVMSAQNLRFALFPLEFWRSQACIVWSCNSNQISEWIAQRWSVQWSKHDGWRGLFIPSKEIDEVEGMPTVILALRQWRGSIEDVALLAHECYHATQYLHRLLVDSEWHGVEEDAARLMERLMLGCLEALDGTPDLEQRNA